jgi:hypothetical protein
MSQFIFEPRFFLELTLTEHPCQITVKVWLATDPVRNKLLASKILNKPKLRYFLFYLGGIFHIFMIVSISICLTKLKDERFHLQHG